MESDVIKSLKARLADLTYILFIMRKEFDFLIQNDKAEHVSHELHKVISSLQDSNSEIIRLYHEIQKHENDMQSEWYDNKESIQNLQNTIENLQQSTQALIAGNQQFLNNTYTS